VNGFMMLFSQILEQLRLAAENVPGLTPLADAPFLFRPLVMVVLLGVVAGVIGVIEALLCIRTKEFPWYHCRASSITPRQVRRRPLLPGAPATPGEP